MSISTASPTVATLNRYRYVAVGSETSVSGIDANGNVLSYTAGFEQVYLNGVMLVRGQDYTATNGTSITGLTALVASDSVEVLTFSPFTITNAVDQTLVNAKGDLIVGTSDNVVTNVTVGSNNQTILADSSQTAGIKWGASPQSLMTATGDLLYASGANTPARLAIGSSSQVLTVSGGVPTWAAPPSVTWGPAFVAYRGTSNQSISGGAATKMQLNATILNAGSCYDAATNYRFTPNIAGYYQVNLSTEIQFVDGSGYTMLYKNGSRYTSFRNYHTNAGISLMSGGSVIMYMNGTTDYVEAYVYAQTSTAYVSWHDGTDSGHFSASFVRGA